MTNTDSPSVNSPETPINVASAPNVKIDTEYSEESDARHEPIPLKLEQASKIDQDVIVPIDPRHETPPGDVEMQEQGQEDGTTPPVLSPFPSAEEDHDQEGAVDTHGGPNGVNGHVVKEEDSKMEEVEDAKDETGPAPLPPTSPTPPAEEGSQGTNADVDESNVHVAPEDQPHPAKRARKHSDADAASVMSNPTPPPAPAPVPPLNGITAHPPSVNPTPTHTQPSTSNLPPASSLSLSQHKFCTSTLKNLKKAKDARPFLLPVDVVAMNIPHYPEIITHPMDFKTIEEKLDNSVPGKEIPKPDQPRYLSADQFITDVRLVFSNCVKFNGPEHTISLMGRRLEELFDKSIKNLPPPEEAKPPPVKKAPPPPPAPTPTTAPAKQRVPRRPSTSTPVIRRNDSVSASGNRPKREIHPPPSKDLPYDVSKKSRKARAAKDNLNAEQLRFCSKLLGELHRKQHWTIASPFYEPVDWVSLNIPTYPKVIKEPMDLSTMRKRLDAHEYSSAQAFFADFKLMIRNCFHFNPPGTPVNLAGIELQRLFDEKWKNLPQPKPQPAYDEDMDVEDDDSEDDNQQRIAEMEKQIEAMKGTISALKQQKKEKPPKKAARQQPTPAASSSSKPAKAAASSSKKSTTTKKSGKKSAAIPGDDDVLTFEQKKDLSEAIQTLDGQKLERVIQIIHEGVPEIRDSTEEIELEIDLLPANVLIKLYNFVIRPLKAAQPKRARTGKGTGTGGLKRKSMDEDVEAEKIRALEARIALFEKGAATTSNGDAGHGAGGANGGGGDRSSDSSDSSDSGSDSE